MQHGTYFCNVIIYYYSFSNEIQICDKRHDKHKQEKAKPAKLKIKLSFSFAQEKFVGFIAPFIKKEGTHHSTQGEFVCLPNFVGMLSND